MQEQKEEKPPILKSWRNIYLLVLGFLVFQIVLFYFFGQIFR